MFVLSNLKDYELCIRDLTQCKHFIIYSASDPAASAQIMQSVKNTLNASPFYFNISGSQARILSGSDEGSFGWVTVNYLAKVFTVRRTGL